MKRTVAHILLATFKALSKPAKAMFAASGALFLAVVALRILAPIVMALFADAVLRSDESWLSIGIAYAAVFFFIRSLEEIRFASYVVFEQQVQRSIVLRVLNDFFIVRFQDAASKSSSEHAIIVERGLGGLRDVLFNGLFTLLPLVLEATLAVIVISVKANVLVGMGCGSAIVTFLAVTYFISDKVQKLQQKWFETASKNFKILSESLRSYELVRSFNVPAWIHTRYASATDGFIGEVKQSLKPGVLLGIVQGVLLFALMLSTSFVTLESTGDNTAKVTQLVLVNGLLLQISAPLLQFSAAYRVFVQGLSSASQLLDLMHLPKGRGKIALLPTTDKHSIYEFQNLEVSFDGKNGLRCESLAIPNANIVGILGSSGSGKTTLAKVMAGILEFSGDVKCAFSTNDIYYCGQNVEIFDLPLSDNIVFGNLVDYCHLNDVLHVSGFSDAEIGSLRDRTLGENGSRISGGQKKRIGIARMLYHQARVMIFDEPTSELDTKTAQSVIETIRQLATDRLVIVITHDQELSQSCDVTIHITNGVPRIAEK